VSSSDWLSESVDPVLDLLSDLYSNSNVSPLYVLVGSHLVPPHNFY